MNKYGLKISKPKEGDFIFGGGNVPMEILQPDGNWQDYLPVKEFQNLNGIEPYACVIFTLLNIVETLIKRKYGEDRNYSDRFLATVIDTRNGGCDPHQAAEFLRKIGVPPQEIWPFDEKINTTEKFFSKPEPKIYEIAREFIEEWDFRHEYVERKNEAITEALKCSPLLMSVAAWTEKNGIYYRPKGRRDNHATTMFYERVGEFRRVFDSYDSPHIKDYNYNDMPEIIKRVWIEKRPVYEAKLNLFQKLVETLKQIVGLLLVKPELPPTPPVEPPKPIVESEKVSKLIPWATAIRDYEGKPGDLNYRNNNPGNLRSVKGPFLKFKTYEAGWNALLDYLIRSATGRHKAYPKGGETTLREFFGIYAPSADRNDPAKYAAWVGKRIGVAVTEKIKNLI